MHTPLFTDPNCPLPGWQATVGGHIEQDLGSVDKCPENNPDYLAKIVGFLADRLSVDDQIELAELLNLKKVP